MSIKGIIILNMHSIAILLVIYFHALKIFEKNSLPDKLFILMLRVTIFMLGVDILSRFDGNFSIIYVVFNHAGNFLIFLVNMVLPSLWLVYVHYQVYRDEGKARRLINYFVILNLANAAALLVSLFYGWFYYIDQDNIYHRGSYFFIPTIVIIVLVLAALAIPVANRKKLGKKSYLSLMLFTILPLVCIVLQLVYYGIPFLLNSLVISLLLAYLNIQDHTIYTDYLTGVSNRKRLDSYLREKISMRTRGKTFSAILLDINNFKYINDTYGHNIGDQALEITAKLLRSCLRAGDFIARYGGDEFCIILDISDKKDLEALVERINKCLDNHNRSGNHVFKLEFSMGYAVYDYQAHLSAEEFLNQVDRLMYEDKHAAKSKSGATGENEG